MARRASQSLCLLLIGLIGNTQSAANLFNHFTVLGDIYPLKQRK